jgi:capsular polysaccharide biosynthesis protein
MAEETKPTRARARGRRRRGNDEVSFVEPKADNGSSTAEDHEAPFPAPLIEPEPAPESRRKMGVWEAFITPTIGSVIVALVAAVVIGGATAAKVHREPPTYESIAALVIDQPKAITEAGSDGIIAKLNALRTKYITLLTTAAFTKPVAQKLGLPEATVATSEEVLAPGPSLVVLVGARSKDQKVSKLIAQTMAEQLVEYVRNEQNRAFIPIADRIEMRIVVAANDAVRVEPTRTRALTVGGAAGATALLIVYIFAQLVFVRRKT